MNSNELMNSLLVVTLLHSLNSKNDFLTVGRDSKVKPSGGTLNQLLNESESSLYPTMSKQSQKIVNYYQTQSLKWCHKKAWVDMNLPAPLSDLIFYTGSAIGLNVALRSSYYRKMNWPK